MRVAVRAAVWDDAQGSALVVKGLLWVAVWPARSCRDLAHCRAPSLPPRQAERASYRTARAGAPAGGEQCCVSVRA